MSWAEPFFDVPGNKKNLVIRCVKAGVLSVAVIAGLVKLPEITVLTILILYLGGNKFAQSLVEDWVRKYREEN